jgi:hypothetical protein
MPSTTAGTLIVNVLHLNHNCNIACIAPLHNHFASWLDRTVGQLPVAAWAYKADLHLQLKYNLYLLHSTCSFA